MNNPFSLEGKNIIVTGASSGIGQQVAILCSQMGAKVVLIGRNIERLEETKSQLEGEGHLTISYDLTDLEHQKDLVSDIVSKIGLIDGLVNCAGISTVLPFKMMKPEKVDEFFRTNVYATIELTRQVLSAKCFNKEGGSVIFFASVMGCVGEMAKSLYSFTKGALISGCRSLAIEYAPKKVRVNVVSPGVVETAINKNQPYLADPDKRKETVNKTIRFPKELVDKIDKQVAENDSYFSTFVIQACEYAVKEMETQYKKDKPNK